MFFFWGTYVFNFFYTFFRLCLFLLFKVPMIFVATCFFFLFFTFSIMFFFFFLGGGCQVPMFLYCLKLFSGIYVFFVFFLRMLNKNLNLAVRYQLIKTEPRLNCTKICLEWVYHLSYLKVYRLWRISVFNWKNWQIVNVGSSWAFTWEANKMFYNMQSGMPNFHFCIILSQVMSLACQERTKKTLVIIKWETGANAQNP